jgi:hypothetical protein
MERHSGERVIGYGGATEIMMIRIFAVGALVAASLAGGSAFAQGDYHHHRFCLMTGTSSECAYDTLDQCMASKRGNADTCVPNKAEPINPNHQ